ncbi:hypothetical protein [Methylocella sp.]|uniref:hypothetical protein n=1 Tax=Methylocella sp. TaxID=1978226 RepID=UPI0037848624
MEGVARAALASQRVVAGAHVENDGVLRLRRGGDEVGRLKVCDDELVFGQQRRRLPGDIGSRLDARELHTEFPPDELAGQVDFIERDAHARFSHVGGLRLHEGEKLSLRIVAGEVENAYRRGHSRRRALVRLGAGGVRSMDEERPEQRRQSRNTSRAATHAFTN